jgi:hypothetical protein
VHKIGGIQERAQEWEEEEQRGEEDRRDRGVWAGESGQGSLGRGVWAGGFSQVGAGGAQGGGCGDDRHKQEQSGGGGEDWIRQTYRCAWSPDGWPLRRWHRTVPLPP